MKKINFLLGVFYILTLIACGSADIEYQDIGHNEWFTDQPISFYLSPEEFSNNKQLYIRYTDDYPFQNLWLKISVSPKDSSDHYTRHQYQLAAPDGKWLGKKSGAFYMISSDLDVSACQSDTCKIVIEQNMRMNPLVGIQSIGIGNPQ